MGGASFAEMLNGLPRTLGISATGAIPFSHHRKDEQGGSVAEGEMAQSREPVQGQMAHWVVLFQLRVPALGMVPPTFQVEAPQYTKPEVCLQGDSKSTQDRGADEPHTLMEPRLDLLSCGAPKKTSPLVPARACSLNRRSEG